MQANIHIWDRTVSDSPEGLREEMHLETWLETHQWEGQQGESLPHSTVPCWDPQAESSPPLKHIWKPRPAGTGRGVSSCIWVSHQNCGPSSVLGASTAHAKTVLYDSGWRHCSHSALLVAFRMSPTVAPCRTHCNNLVPKLLEHGSLWQDYPVSYVPAGVGKRYSLTLKPPLLSVTVLIQEHSADSEVLPNCKTTPSEEATFLIPGHKNHAPTMLIRIQLQVMGPYPVHSCLQKIIKHLFYLRFGDAVPQIPRWHLPAAS